jgi:hypothetical protein
MNFPGCIPNKAVAYVIIDFIGGLRSHRSQYWVIWL